MAKIEKLLAQIKNNPKDVNFTDLVKICNHYFGEPRQEGTSHYVYKTPWAGDPRVNIQEKNGKAKVYQVKQVLEAIKKIEKIEEIEDEEL
ncbi:toxin HicA [Nostocaceae cyanobacterium CENA369]|uniref:Toxin HicA n=1 Tax=Dendronalium phyllosphericum CENA369 TaxID=1725256 RepID=A0A8J7IT23_9NOST|nr:toxin HicA [Dendronalium phyllosphericum]MBH8577667.1 toxin HicA [Dendronalium phyllosphericum CENA369]